MFSNQKIIRTFIDSMYQLVLFKFQITSDSVN